MTFHRVALHRSCQNRAAASGVPCGLPAPRPGDRPARRPVGLAALACPDSTLVSAVSHITDVTARKEALLARPQCPSPSGFTQETQPTWRTTRGTFARGADGAALSLRDPESSDTGTQRLASVPASRSGHVFARSHAPEDEDCVERSCSFGHSQT